MASKSNLSPMAFVDLRAQIEDCNPGFCKILGAFNLKGWKNGKKKLKAKELAAYTGMNLDRVNDLTKGMAERGWLKRTRTSDGYDYEKTIEEMTWDEAHEIARFRMDGEPKQQVLIPKGYGKTPDQGQGKTPDLIREIPSPDMGNPQSPNSTKDSLKDLKPKTPPATPGKHPLQDQWWDKASTTWRQKFGSNPVWLRRSNLQPALNVALEGLGPDGLFRRLQNMIADDFCKKDFWDVVYNPDRYAGTPRKKEAPRAPWQRGQQQEEGPGESQEAFLRRVYGGGTKRIEQERRMKPDQTSRIIE